jgi:hypothetical protein
MIGRTFDQITGDKGPPFESERGLPIFESKRKKSRHLGTFCSLWRVMQKVPNDHDQTRDLEPF